MGLYEKAPNCDESLATVSHLEASEIQDHNDLNNRITRYSKAKKHSLLMRDFLLSENSSLSIKVRASLSDCANYLHFRDYFTVKEVRLHTASFCKQHLVCPLCAIRRASKNVTAYLEKYNLIINENPYLKPFMITFTVLNGNDLLERFNHLKNSFRKLQNNMRLFLSNKNRAYTELSLVKGAVFAYEISDIGNGWHPHLHMIGLCPRRPSWDALVNEWKNITGDSFIVHVRELSEDVSDGFIEVLKYALKFSELSPSQNWEAYKILRSKRLMGSFGLFRGVKIPESLLDEPLENLPYFDRFYRFINGHYKLTGESPVNNRE